MNEWQEHKLGDLYDVSSGLSKPADQFGFGHTFISFKDVFNNYFIPEYPEGLVNSNEKDWKSCSVKKGDILITRTSETIEEVGMSSVALKDYEKSTFNGFCKRLRLKENTPIKVSPHFMGYLLRTRFFRKTVANFATMTTRASLNGESIKSIPLKFPPYEIQEEIGMTLYSLEKKISLLRQQNQTLEELAQTLFKRWFVEFEFPCLPSDYRPQGQVNLSEMAKICTYQRVGGLPAPDGNNWFIYVLLCEDGSFYKGMTNDIYRRFYEHYTGQGAKHTKAHKPKKVIHWEKFDTQDQARKREEELKSGYGRTWIQRQWEKVQGGLPTPECQLRMAGKMVDSVPTSIGMGEIPEGWRVGTLGEIIVNYDSKRIPLSSNQRMERQGKYPYHGATSIMDYVNDFIFDGRYVLVGEDGSVVDEHGFPILQFVEGKIWVNNHAHVIEGKDPFSTNYIFLQLRKTKVSHIVTGAVQLKINQGNLNSLEILIPDMEVVQSFDISTKQMFNKIFSNKREIQTLTQLRDTLLPKLMSGELTINLKKCLTN